MSTQGQQLYESFAQVKKASMKFFPHDHSEQLKPHEFFMLNAIKNSYRQLEIKAESLSNPPPPGVKISEISRFTSISMPGVSQTISHLVDCGYVQRLTTEKDRRIVYVKVTSKGESLETSISEGIFSFFDQAAETLGTEDTESLVFLLNKLALSLSDIKKKNTKGMNK